MPLPRSLALALLLAWLVGLGCASSSPSTGAAAPAKPGPTMTCPPPLGTIPKEDCAEIADDFGALQVNASLAHAGQGKGAEPRVEAIHAVAALAESIKDQRVKLCQTYVRCKVPVAEHDAEDARLAGGMRSLIDLWNKRRFSSADEVMRFHAAVRAIDQRVNGTTGDGSPKVAPPQPPKAYPAEQALHRVEDPGVAFRLVSGAINVSAGAEGKRDALRSSPEVLPLPGGRRWRVKVIGHYTPVTAALVQPGDELVARLKYRAAQAADLTLALRSLEDPEASEGSEAWHVGAGEKGAREARLTADPQQTGFYLGVALHGGPVDLDDVELLRGGKVIAAAHAEGADEPGAKTDCAISRQKALAGKASLRCQEGKGDRVTLGKPEGYLALSLRDPGGERGIARTLSLQGGRSVDGLLVEDGELVITLVGAGSATIEQLEVTDLGGG